MTSVQSKLTKDHSHREKLKIRRELLPLVSSGIIPGTIIRNVDPQGFGAAISDRISLISEVLKSNQLEKSVLGLLGRYIVVIKEIDEKHLALGGNSGFLGTPTSDYRRCPDRVGWYRHYQNGSIYYRKDIGAHEVHGPIREKWASLEFERGFLGYPLTDETTTPDGVGRYNQFEGGVIYWSPASGAHELHGSILEKWVSLGFEKSWLGYPTSDESEFAEGGRVSVFEHGAIYWWPDTGAIDLNDVVVSYTGLACFGETDYDGGSDSDEPYFVLGVIAPTHTWTIRTNVYDDVDGGESRPDLLEVYRGKPRGITLSVLLMEHDYGDPDEYKFWMQTAVSSLFAGSPFLIGVLSYIPVVGPVIQAIGSPITFVRDKIASQLSTWLGTDDDKIDIATFTLTPKQMVLLAARESNSNFRGIGFKFETSLLSGKGASYKAYFGLVPA